MGGDAWARLPDSNGRVRGSEGTISAMKFGGRRPLWKGLLEEERLGKMLELWQ